MPETGISLLPIGFIHSPLKDRSSAPKQGSEGAPDAWLDVNSAVAEGLDGLAVGDEIIVITWFHQAQRDILKVHPRDDLNNPLTGVFATRSSDSQTRLVYIALRCWKSPGTGLKSAR